VRDGGTGSPDHENATLNRSRCTVSSNRDSASSGGYAKMDMAVCSRPYPNEEQEAETERCCKRWPNAPHCNGDYTRAMSLPRCAKLPHLANIKCAATGEVIPTRNPKGYITYTREGRMVALIVRNCCAGAANDHPAAAAPLSSVMNSRRNWAGGVREAYQRGNAADLLQGSYTRRQEQAFACRPG
jgi:hypothetical protein